MKRKIFELTVAVYRVTDHFPPDEPLKNQLRRSANEVMAGIIEFDYSSGRLDRARDIVGSIQSLRSLIGVAKLTNFVEPINMEVLDREYSFFYAFFERELNDLIKAEVGKTTGNSIKSDMSLINDIKSFSSAGQSLPAASAKDYSARDQSNFSSVAASTLTNNVAGAKTPETATKDERKKAFVEKSITFSERISVNGNGNGQHSSVETAPAYTPAQAPQKPGELNERQRSIVEYIRANQSVKSTDLGMIFSNQFSLKTLQRDLSYLIEKNIIAREGDKRWAVYRMK